MCSPRSGRLVAMVLRPLNPLLTHARAELCACAVLDPMLLAAIGPRAHARREVIFTRLAAEVAAWNVIHQDDLVRDGHDDHPVEIVRKLLRERLICYNLSFAALCVEDMPLLLLRSHRLIISAKRSSRLRWL